MEEVKERVEREVRRAVNPPPTVPPTPLPTPEPKGWWEFWKGQPEAPKPPSPAAAAGSRGESREQSGSNSNLLRWDWLDEQPIIGGIVKPARAEATKVYEWPVLGGVARALVWVFGEGVLDLPSKIVSIVQNVEVPVRWMINAGFGYLYLRFFGAWTFRNMGRGIRRGWRAARNRRTPPGPTIVP